MTFNIKGSNFYLDDKKVFLNSGEIHYFRIKRSLWDKHLEAAKDAGLNAVSTYIPWAWHEPEETVFDFEGSSCPERDLNGWLRQCHAHGLNCIVKPGPIILAEFRGAGIPDWFMDKYRDEVRMRNRKGEKVQSEGVSLFNSKYLEKVALWFDKIIPFLREREINAGGPVIMMQLCNEIGLFSWLAKQGDYGNTVKEKFIAYISNKYSDIDEVNKLWGTGYHDPSHIEMPPDGNLPYQSKGDRSRDYEWHCFWRTYYGEYLKILTGMVRDRGISVPLFHNLPGWIYGHGYEFPVNITMYEDLFDEKAGIVFGIDHIPEFLTYRNMHDDRIINDVTTAMQGNKPLFAAEFQSGSREYQVVTNPREMELFYKTSIANGLTGWNYYMFSQGQNPARKGYSGRTFYWFTPLSAEGNRSGVFPLISRMSKIVKTSESLIVSARRRAEICILFYPPYYATELERPVESVCELNFIPSAIRRQAYFDGLLKALQLLNIDYDMIDLTRTSSDKLGAYKQVWTFSTDEMNAGDQQTLVNYIKSGGNCVLFPYLPDRDMLQRPCTIIRDSFSISPSGSESIDSPLIDIYDLKDIKCSNPQITYSEESLKNAEIIARTVNGVPCGFTKTLGNGVLIHLGTWIGFDTEDHKHVYEAILNKSGAKLRQASAGNENLSIRERFTEDNSAILFAGNYYNEEQTGNVTYTHPESGEIIKIPYVNNESTWPPLYGVLTPLCLLISDGIKILHSTSDILGVNTIKGQIEITLYGDRDMPGEIVFEGGNINNIRFAKLNNKPVKLVRDDKRVSFMYNHEHKNEMILKIKIK